MPRMGKYQYFEATSGSAASDLKCQQYEAKLRGESRTTAKSSLSSRLKFFTGMFQLQLVGGISGDLGRR